MMKSCFLALLTLGMACAMADAPIGARPVVYAANYPLAYFANRIAGDLAEVGFPAPSDVDPAFWMPDEATLLGYQRADLILLNGAGYERWTRVISLPASRVVDTTRPVADRYIRTGEVVTHTHGPSGEHAHENLAFTTWLDLNIAAEQAKSIAHALSGRIPALT